MTKDLIDLGYESLLEFVIVFLNPISSSASEIYDDIFQILSYQGSSSPYLQHFDPLILGF